MFMILDDSLVTVDLFGFTAVMLVGCPEHKPAVAVSLVVPALK